jgi:hypothetical protein
VLVSALLYLTLLDPFSLAPGAVEAGVVVVEAGVQVVVRRVYLLQRIPYSL